MKVSKWGVSILIGCIVYIGSHSSNETLRNGIRKIVYQTEYIFYDTQWQPTMILTQTQPINTYTSVKRSGDGVYVKYDNQVVLSAIQNGVVVFTGHTAHLGKVISIAYNDGITATFGGVDEFYHLPYSSVVIGEKLAIKGAGDMYVEVEQNGRKFTLEETIDWLRND